MIYPIWPHLRSLLRPAIAAVLAVAPVAASATIVNPDAKLSPNASNQPQAFNTVVIDAGHGGHDRGKVPKTAAPEKELTLDVARRLQKALEGSSLRTVLTRTDDTFVSLPDRVKTGNAEKNAVFVSIHFNSGQRLAARGFETFYTSAKSADLANSLHQALLASADTENRGIKQRRFYVLRYSKIPAVLLECGFLSNEEENRTLLQNPAFRQRVAENLATALISSSNQVTGSKMASRKD